MSNPKNPAALLAALLSGLSHGTINVIELEIDPNKSIEEQLEAIGEKIEAAHRAECAHCQAEWEAKQPKTPEKEDARHMTAIRHEQEVRDLKARQAKERAESGLYDDKPARPYQGQADYTNPLIEAGALRQYRSNDLEVGLPLIHAYDKDITDKVLATMQARIVELQSGSGGAKPVFHEIGFMAFGDGNAIKPSFSFERGDVEKALAKFRSDPMVAAINAMMGTDVLTADIQIRPVYDKRED